MGTSGAAVEMLGVAQYLDMEKNLFPGAEVHVPNE